MKKYILVVSIFVISLYATSETDMLVKDFYKNVKPDYKNSSYMLEKSDKFYKNAISYLNNPLKMVTKEITTPDPEAKTKQKPLKISLPDYINAQKNFHKSYDEYKNPISAYIGLYIYKTKIPALKMNDLLYKRKYIELLYQKLKTCGISIDYSDVLLNGVAGTPNIKKALSVLTKAKKECYGNASDWEKRVIDMKISKIQFKIDLSPGKF